MEFIEILKDLISKKHITKNKMLKDLKMGTGTFATWEKRGTVPSGETLSKLANYFGVSVDYLLGVEQKNKPVAQSDGQNPLDLRIMELLGQLNSENKKIALAQLAAMLKIQGNK